VPLVRGQAVVTVACELEDQAGRVVYLAVPIARGASGGLAVVALPWLVSGPPAGQAQAQESQPLAGVDAGEISRLVGSFLPLYVGGGQGADLSYLIAPGVQLIQVGGGLKLTRITAVGQLRDGAGSKRTVLAQAWVRDAASGATYPVAYRLDLVRRDRWYVAGVQGALR
jgi:Conjugative transposon protein TcpC